VLRNSGAVFLLSHYYSQAQVGQHSRTIRLLFGPLSIIASAVGQVFYQRAADCHQNGGNLRQLVVKVVLALTGISVPMFLIVMFFGPDLFAWFLGENWRQAGEFGRLLAPWVFLNFITTPVSQIPIIVNRQKTAFLISVIGHTLFLAAIAVGGICHNINLGFILVSASQLAFLGFMLFWIIKICNSKNQYDG
jgi:O-antigen/teichoic acid export membrane protein